MDSKRETIPSSNTHYRARQDHWEESKASILQSNFLASKPGINTIEKIINSFGKLECKTTNNKEQTKYQILIKVVGHVFLWK